MLRRGLVALLLLALAVGLTACGGARDTLDPVAAAATKSATAGGVKISMKITYAAAGVSGSMTANGAVDRNEGELTFDMSSILKGLGLPAGTDTDVKIVYVGEDGHQLMYIRVPFLAGMLPAGKTWVKVDVDRAATAAGVDLDKLLGQSQNPADTLAMLRASGDVEQVGSGEVGGVAVTKYHAILDLERAAKLKGIDAQTVQHLLDAGAPKQLPVDVWVGTDDGLPYRLHIAYDTNAAGPAVSAGMTMTMSDWGTDVSVAAPPADQVFDATELAAKAGKS